MKKIYLTLALVFVMGLNVFAQRNDGFFNYYNDGPYNRLDNPSDIGIILPQSNLGSNHQNEPAPLGSGLLILTALGVGYTIRKRKE